MLVIIFGAVGFFGSHFGYSSDTELIKLQNLPEIINIEKTSDIHKYLVTFDTGYKEVMTVDEIKNYANKGVPERSVMGFLKDLAFFNIDDCPVFLSALFDIMVIVLLYLIVTSFTPFIPGG